MIFVKTQILYFSMRGNLRRQFHIKSLKKKSKQLLNFSVYYFLHLAIQWTLRQPRRKQISNLLSFLFKYTQSVNIYIFRRLYLVLFLFSSFPFSPLSLIFVFGAKVAFPCTAPDPLTAFFLHYKSSTKFLPKFSLSHSLKLPTTTPKSNMAGGDKLDFFKT